MVVRSLAAAVTAAALLIPVAGPVSGAAGTPDGSTVVSGPEGLWSRPVPFAQARPGIHRLGPRAVNRRGDVALLVGSDRGPNAVLRLYVAGSRTWLPPVDLPESPWSASLVLDDAGIATVVWIGYPDNDSLAGEWGVRARRYDPGSGTWSVAAVLPRPDAESSLPVLMVDAAGAVTALGWWQGQAWSARLEPGSAAWVSTGTLPVSGPDLQGDATASGTVFALGSYGRGLGVTRWEAGSGWSEPTVFGSTDPALGTIAYRPRLAVGDGGDAVVAWQQYTPVDESTAPPRVQPMLRAYRPGDGSWSPMPPPDRGADTTAGELVLDGNGNLFAINGSQWARWDYRARTWSTPPDPVPSSYDPIQVVVDGDGNATAGWVGNDTVCVVFPTSTAEGGNDCLGTVMRLRTARYDADTGTWSPGRPHGTRRVVSALLAAAPGGDVLAVLGPAGATGGANARIASELFTAVEGPQVVLVDPQGPTRTVVRRPMTVVADTFDIPVGSRGALTLDGRVVASATVGRDSTLRARVPARSGTYRFTVSPWTSGPLAVRTEPRFGITAHRVRGDTLRVTVAPGALWRGDAIVLVRNGVEVPGAVVYVRKLWKPVRLDVPAKPGRYQVRAHRPSIWETVAEGADAGAFVLRRTRH